jgi:hypothetical protein
MLEIILGNLQFSSLIPMARHYRDTRLFLRWIKALKIVKAIELSLIFNPRMIFMQVSLTRITLLSVTRVGLRFLIECLWWIPGVRSLAFVLFSPVEMIAVWSRWLPTPIQRTFIVSETRWKLWSSTLKRIRRQLWASCHFRSQFKWERSSKKSPIRCEVLMPLSWFEPSCIN